MPLDNDYDRHQHHHHHHHENLPNTFSPHHHHHYLSEGNCGNDGTPSHDDAFHHHHNIDLVTTLRSELAALTYQNGRLKTELTETKSSLCSKDSECENLRAQTARQTALISSLQSRLHSAENREESIQVRCDSTIQTIQREKRSIDDRCRELLTKIQHLETHEANAESQIKLAHQQMSEFLRRLSTCLDMEVSESSHLTTDCVLARVEELMTELQRTKNKVTSTCDTLSSCENELMNLKSLANIEKQRLTNQLESSTRHAHELESRCRQYEHDLQLQRERLTELDIVDEKLKEELKGFESRCYRLQSNLDRVQNDRLQFLRHLAQQLNTAEPCETLIKDRLKEILTENRNMSKDVHVLQEQLASQQNKLKETHLSSQTNQCRLRNEEAVKCDLADRLEKCYSEIHNLRQDHLGLSQYLQRLAKAMHWNECSSPPNLGTDTNNLAENLLEKAQRISSSHHRDICNRHHHSRSADKSCCDHYHQPRNHVYAQPKIRREKSCHDIPLKDTNATTTTLYNLQRKVRILKEQIQKRDLHLELLKRKLSLIEDGALGKCTLQRERDEAVYRYKKACKTIEKLSAQVSDTRLQVTEFKNQLAEAVDYKIIALERARKIDELTTQICDLEEENSRLVAQLNVLKERLKASSESSQNRRCRDEALISSLRDDLSHVQAQLSDAKHRLSQLQSFRTAVARTLHLRDLPETDLLHRLQALCSAHQEFTMLSKRYESASPMPEHICPRYNDSLSHTTHCLPTRCTSSPPHIHGHLS